MLKTLVITSCTGEKRYKPDEQLMQNDFIDNTNLSLKEGYLKEYQQTAGRMYTGLQHLRLMEGIEVLRNTFQSESIDLNIVSAGYGLINEDKVIVPYEVTFNSMNSKQVLEWSKHLNIKEDLEKKIKGYDLVFFLLGDKYLKSLQLPVHVETEGQKLIFLAGKSSRSSIPNEAPYHLIEVGQEDAKEFSYGLIGLKGYLFKLLSEEIKNNTNLLNSINDDPSLILDVLDKYRIKRKSSEQLGLFSDEIVENKLTAVKQSKKKTLQKKKVELIVPSDLIAKNYSNFKMMYYMPENDDRVDPKFNFINDLHTLNRDPYSDDVYSHEIYDPPNYDGLLVSMMNIIGKTASKTKSEKVLSSGGIHNFLRAHSNLPILGDCGAYSYRNDYEPPFETEEILNYYETLGFNIGVSIDHLIFNDQDQDERKRRLTITQENAEKFIKGHYNGNYTFKPSGIAQGWDVNSYVESVQNLVDMGYQHISLGGLAFSPTEEIYGILKNISPILPEYMEVHLFGAARLDPINTFNKLGVTSFDSTSSLRQAWMSAKSNYHTLDGKKYAAIRVPQATEKSPKIKKAIEKGVGTLDLFKRLERNALNALRQYDKGNLGIEETLEAVLEYDNLLGDKYNKHEEAYRLVLEDQPWKKCCCKICREVGIEVVIFRGNNRNRRRGFHNTYVFYKRFSDIQKKGLKN
jgi:Queuine tRNA-ribosyltransferase